jgi:hypothetical protein
MARVCKLDELMNDAAAMERAARAVRFLGGIAARLPLSASDPW